MTDFGTRHTIHATKHQDGGADEVDATGLDGRLRFVEREGAEAYDFDQDDLTQDTDWHDLDLSAIVTAGAKIILLSIRVQNTAAGKALGFIGKSGASTISSQRQYTQRANGLSSKTYILPCDSTRVVQYNTGGTGWTYIWGVVAGWFI